MSSRYVLASGKLPRRAGGGDNARTDASLPGRDVSDLGPTFPVRTVHSSPLPLGILDDGGIPRDGLPASTYAHFRARDLKLICCYTRYIQAQMLKSRSETQLGDGIKDGIYIARYGKRSRTRPR